MRGTYAAIAVAPLSSRRRRHIVSHTDPPSRSLFVLVRPRWQVSVLQRGVLLKDFTFTLV